MSVIETGWQTWWGGPARQGYRRPMQHQPIVAAQLPARAAVPGVMQGEWRTRGWVFHWGTLPLEVSGPTTDSPEAGPNTNVGEDPSRIRRCEDARCVPILDLAAQPRVWELARCTWSNHAVAGLKRIGTYLQAQPLDAQGNPDGPPFITGMDTPLCVPVVHPTLGESLSFVWSARLEDDEFTPRIIAAPEGSIPVSAGIDGLPWNWGDFRYSWQSRYSDNQSSILTGRTARLFVTLSAPTPQQWRITAGGMLSVWWQVVNSYAPAITRHNVRTK